MSQLTPPDLAQCQCDITEYHPFVMGGPVRQTHRCTNVAQWLATETEPGPDGLKGSMSVCDRCAQELIKQRALAPDSFTLDPIINERSVAA
jgi:hypothetical protein